MESPSTTSRRCRATSSGAFPQGRARACAYISILQGGAFFGALFAAPIQNGIGRKKCLMLGCSIFIVGGVVQTACFRSLSQFYVGRLLAGIGVGIMSSACPTYASEIAPKDIRGRVTGLFQIIVVTGVAAAFYTHLGSHF